MVAAQLAGSAGCTSRRATFMCPTLQDYGQLRFCTVVLCIFIRSHFKSALALPLAVDRVVLHRCCISGTPSAFGMRCGWNSL